MNKISHIKFPHSIEIDVSPKDYDLSVASVDNQGNSGRLNSYILAELGYKNKPLPDEKELQNGFYLLQDNYRKPVLFIVTVGEDYTQNLFKKNLLNGLQSNYNLLTKKNIWLPLLGTGTGNLSLSESLSITTQVLNEFADTMAKNTLSVHFTIALPKTLEARELLRNIQLNAESRENKVSMPFEKLHENIESSENKKSIYYQLEQYLHTFKGKYFLTGSVWSNNTDQAARFYEDNIWENGYEDRYIEVVKSANPGDIIFLKSTYTRNKISYLRIKGIGIVLSNPQTGIQLKVNWVVKNIQANLPNLGKYRSTILTIENNSDLRVIIEGIIENTDSNIYDNLRAIIGTAIEKISSNIYTSMTNKVDYRQPITNRSTIAELNSDNEVKEDFLDIKKDIQAFSKIMASKSFKPPLAIALLGKWGSGKSFFMNQLKDSISILANQHPLLYCKGIAQIHFNAWSYLDANLWASIVTKIFEGLNEYITKDTKANKLKEQIEKELSCKLTITKEEIQLLEKQKKTIEQQLLSLDTQYENLKIQLSTDIDSIENNTLMDVLIKVDKEFQLSKRIRDTLQNSPTWKITESEFKKLIPEEYWENPKVLYQQIQSKYTFLREFSNWKNIGGSTLRAIAS